jgi:hypothetical protein
MKKLALILLLLSFVFSCATSQETKSESPETIAVSQEDLPKTIAIMPFQNSTDEPDIALQVRKAFYNHFSSKPYRDVEPSIVDEKIVYLEKNSGKQIYEIKPEDICKPIGCDGLVYGKVTEFKRLYAAVYSQFSVEAEIWMVNAKTGKEVFKLKDSARYHEGSVPLSPLGAIMTAISTAMNLREIQRIRLINELAYKLNEKIPSPSGMAFEDRPKIKEVLTNAKEGPFGKGKIIKVGLEGEPAMVAMFDIGNFKMNMPMKEEKPGIYIGEYPIMPGDNANSMPIVTYLKRPAGLESQWIDVTGLITIDTTPPQQVKTIRARGFVDRIEIRWETVKNTPDLKGYKLFRSEQPLSGYTEISRTEMNLFEDKTAQPGIIYYYRVVAFDSTGNESEVHDSVKASLISKEPVVIYGELKKDTQLLSGLYIIKGDLIIPQKITLSIEPDTKIMVDENMSIKVYGKLVVDGKESPVEFVPSKDKKWKGIEAVGGNITANGVRIISAINGFTIQNSEGTIENAMITGSDTAISISGIPSATIKLSVISGNKTGIKLQKTDAKVLQNNILQNKEGILIKEFSGEIKDNNIFDNVKNITAEYEMKIGANFLGSINVDEMKLSKISVAKTYDNKVPDGKIVDAISNPYAALSQEEQKKKSAEIFADGEAYFQQRNYGKAVTRFEEALKAYPMPEAYYYIALCYQEMKEDDKAVKYLKDGLEKFPKDSTILKSLGMMYYQKGNDAEAKKIFEEVLRLSPEDRQIKFLLERMKK